MSRCLVTINVTAEGQLPMLSLGNKIWALSVKCTQSSVYSQRPDLSSFGKPWKASRNFLLEGKNNRNSGECFYLLSYHSLPLSINK